MQYSPHEKLIAPARPSSHPLRLVVGFVIAAVTYLSLTISIFAIATGLLATDGDFDAAQDALISATTPGTVLFALYSFILMITALWVVLRLLHKRRLAGLFGPRREFSRQFLRVSAYLLALLMLLFMIPSSDALPLSKGLNLGIWLQYLPFALIGLMIQVSAEELVFRGYIQSQLAARFPHPLIWMVLPSALFGWLHYDPVLAGENAWIIAALTGIYALAAADLTARSGTLGPAIALHLFNNISAILIIAPLGDISGLALYTYPLAALQDSGNSAIFALDFLFVLCSWLMARLALRR